MHVDALELLWIALNAANVVITFDAFLDARRDRIAVRNGSARALVAAGNVRREVWRLVAQVLLLSLVLPGIFVDRPVQLTPFVATLIGVSVALLVNTLTDRHDRGRLAAIVEAELSTERTS